MGRLVRYHGYHRDEANKLTAAIAAAQRFFTANSFAEWEAKLSKLPPTDRLRVRFGGVRSLRTVFRLRWGVTAGRAVRKKIFCHREHGVQQEEEGGLGLSVSSFRS